MDMEDLLRKMTDGDIESLSKPLSDLLEERVQKKVDLLLSRGEYVMSSIVDYIKIHGYMDDDLFYYDIESSIAKDISSVDFNTVFDFIRDSSEVHLSDEECFFDNNIYYCDYDGFILELNIMWGQGTHVSISIPNNDSYKRCKDIINFRDIYSRFHSLHV